MRAAEEGFLLLTGKLGNPERRPLSVAQFRNLALRVTAAERKDKILELEPQDLIPLGYGRAEAERIVKLLGETQQLHHYLYLGKRQDCYPITRISGDYPLEVRKRLGLDAPGALWAKGNAELLKGCKIALVGSRALEEPNWRFAFEAGKQAATQGYTLVSGNATGADQTAQEACLEYGGQVISVVAGRLDRCPLQRNVLYLSEDGYDLDFTSARAHSRNRVIHTLGRLVLVAQSALGAGGSWAGTQKNLHNRWSGVYCFQDGSAAAKELGRMGAHLIGVDALAEIYKLEEAYEQSR